jgi:hypothetical protein
MVQKYFKKLHFKSILTEKILIIKAEKALCFQTALKIQAGSPFASVS